MPPKRAAGAGVGLLKRLEDDALLVGRDADARVADREGNDHAATFCSSGDPALQPVSATPMLQLDLALRRELEGVGQQVLEHLMQPLEVGRDAARQLRIDVDVERQALGFRHVAEVALHRVAQHGEGHVLRLDGHRARFDLGEVEDVADQVEQVGAGSVNGLGELDLLGRQVALGVLAQLLAEDRECC